MTFGEWCDELIELFNAAGVEWHGYGDEIIALDPEAANEAFKSGITPYEIYEGELDTGEVER